MAKKKPPVKTLDAFFRPASVPPTPANKSTSRPKTPASNDKGKRKAIATIDLDSSDDDVQIIEPGPSKKVAREGAAIRGVVPKMEVEDTPVAGPSKCFFLDSDAEDEIGGIEEAKVEEVVEQEVVGMEIEVETPDAVEVEGDETVEILNVDIQAWGDDVAEGDPQEEDESQDVASEGGEEIEEDNWGEETMPTINSQVVDDDEECTIVQGSSKDHAPATEDSCPICCEVLTTLSKSRRQSHVNGCLDGPPDLKLSLPALPSLFRPTASSPTIKPTAKTPVKLTAAPSRRPLSALPGFLLPPAKTTPGLPNAFTTLMQSHTEGLQWRVAEKSDKTKGRMPKGEKRTVPFYKWVEGMQVTVDAFKYGKIEGCKGYFLSHAHSDHYQLLNSSWKNGPIYCSVTTANLIKLKLKVADKWLVPLPMNVTMTIQGIQVTLIDANHCPGSTLFLFEGPHTDPNSAWSKTPSKIFRHLHCGDFRASPAHLTHPAMVGKKIDICYLDTTYLDARYCFPAQELVIDACSALVKQFVEGDEGALSRVGGEEQMKGEKAMRSWLEKEVKVEVKDEGDVKEEDGGEGKGKGKMKEEEGEKKPVKKERLLVLVGTYSIGKERIVKGIAQALNTKIYCDDAKLALFKAQDDPLLHSLITRDPLKAQVHCVFLSHINHDALSTYLSKYRNVENGFTKLIGLRPTGWTYKPGVALEKNPAISKVLERESQRKFSAAGMYPQRDSTASCLAYGVPYSEHSSFFELTCFALSLNYVRMIPTVNVGSESSRAKMSQWFAMWSKEKKRRAEMGIRGMVTPRSPTYW